MIAKSETYFFGFSLITVIFPDADVFATPNNSGFITLCKITFAPLLSFVQEISFEVKSYLQELMRHFYCQ